ncbi:hypothetical protein [Litoribacter populi]|uniref:hypothetical protein n=1 Tax=Litoribacter populi TaxID=2598460 RepID=UPI00117EA743|nr:hypothetical protein [Litoribacter populi]
MKKYFTLFILSFLIFGGELMAQQTIELELYGGPAVSHFSAEVGMHREEFSFLTPISGHFGVNLLTKLNDKFQIATQLEYMQSTWEYERSLGTGGTYTTAARINRSLNYSIGLRYNHQVKNKIFFAQAGFGGSRFLYGDFLSQRMNQSKEHLTFRVEVGTRIYNKRNNYFVLGLRHQQGINRHTVKNPEPIFNTPPNTLRDRGSFTGLFVGYGIGSNNKKSILKSF